MDWTLTIALATAIVAFFTLLDWFVSREEEERTKARLAEWFVRLDDYDFLPSIAAFHLLFNGLFRSIYGVRIFSWRFLIASATSSYFAIAVVATIFLALGRFGDAGIEDDRFEAMIGISLFVNVWVDVASLAETRWILAEAEGKPIWALIALLGLDLLLSGSLFLVPFYLLLSAFEGYFIPISEVARDVFSWSRTTEPHIQVSFLSTFFTSAAFYLFMCTALLARALGLARSRLLVLIDKLERSNHLYKSIGTLLACLLGVLKAVHEIFKG